jgi:hypothetical protein
MFYQNPGRIQLEQRRREAAVVKKLRNSELILMLRKRASAGFVIDLLQGKVDVHVVEEQGDEGDCFSMDPWLGAVKLR